MFENEGVAAVLVAFEVIGRGFTTKIAINALVVNVIFARSVLRIFICSVSHKIVYLV